MKKKEKSKNQKAIAKKKFGKKSVSKSKRQRCSGKSWDDSRGGFGSDGLFI